MIKFLRALLNRQQTPRSVPGPVSSANATRRLEAAWATSVGEVRRHNEDTALVITAAHDGDGKLSSFGLCILADGMGGHQSGEVASSLAARAVAHHLMGQFYLPSLIGQEHDTYQPALNEVLVDAVREANSAVEKQVPGGGTTLTCALVLGSRAHIAHVGDSRAYIISEGKMEQITHDHSLVDRLIELGQLSPDEAAEHPQRNVLYRAVGQSGLLEVDTHIRSIPDGGSILLCSDGLWGMITEAQMLDIVTDASSHQAACDSLVAAANKAGGRDNITVILMRPPLDHAE
jgi:protein phosphatase